MKTKLNISPKAVLGLVALATLVGTLVSPQSVRADAVTDVSAGELSGLQQLYAVSNNQWDFNDAYLVDNSGSIATGSFSRVGYYVELGPAGNTNWVWASMNTFNPDPTQVGVPRAGTGIVQNGTVVSNLNIESNHPNLAGLNGQTGQNGIIEFWASNYNANGGGAFGSNDSLFDWKDSGGSSGGGHGSFQVFALDAGLTNGTTLFGVTANGGSGIGDQPGHPPSNSPDWTFGPGTGSYAVRNLEIWVGTPAPIGSAVPEPTSLAIALLGVAGAACFCWRRRKLIGCRTYSVLLAVAIALIATSAHADFFSNGGIPASEKGGMQLAYELNNVPATNPAWRNATPVPYNVNNSGSIGVGSYTRIGYYMEVTAGTQAGNYVYISMDSFDPDPTTIGYPHNVNNPVARQTIVNNANVFSNNANVTPVTGSSTVNLEMWSTNYNQGPGAIPNNTGRFDWSDGGFGIGAGHGSFQIHNFGLLETLFGHSDWGGNTPGQASEFGIGNANAPGLGEPNEDWTFSERGQSGFLQIIVGTPSPVGAAVPEPSTLVLAGLALLSLGFVGWRRRGAMKMAKLTTIAMFVGLTISLAGVADAQVVNGNFEDQSNGGLGTGAWVLEDAAITNNGGFGPSTPPLASQDAGTRLMTLQNGNNGGRIAQDVPTAPGTFYELSFYHNNLDNNGTQGSGVQSVTWSVGPAGSEIVGPNNFAYPDSVGAGDVTYGWTQQTEVFQAAAPATRIAFQGTPDSNGGFWGIQLDNVSLTQTASPNPAVPEPSTMLLACLAAVGAAMFGWRRRRVA